MTNKLKTELSSQSYIQDHFTVKKNLLDLFYVFIFSTLVAFFLTLSGITKPFVVNLIISLSVGFSITLIIHLLFWILRPSQEKTLGFALILSAGVIGGTILGFKIGPLFLQYFFGIVVDLKRWSGSPKAIVVAITISAVITYFFYSKAKIRRVLAIAEKERADRLAGEKAVLESNLKLLQAQVEPHFLFNTLSNILSLIDTDPAKGKVMLMNFIGYLRTSLSRTLPEKTTLNQEITGIEAYLKIQQIRMDERLSFTIDVPDMLRQHSFPPMLLQPLVENAVKHGLEPSVDGGTIIVRVRVHNGRLRIEVSDTGLGITQTNSNGVGLKNVRERLRLLYGNESSFIVEENEPHGVRVIIEVPESDL